MEQKKEHTPFLLKAQGGVCIPFLGLDVGAAPKCFFRSVIVVAKENNFLINKRLKSLKKKNLKSSKATDFKKRDIVTFLPHLVCH